MTHPAELDADGEIPSDFTSHLAARLHLAPDAVLAHLEFWLAHYQRPRRAAPGPVKTYGRPSTLHVQATVG